MYTPVLCNSCRRDTQLTIPNITKSFQEEISCYEIAHALHHSTIINMDPPQRLFPLTFAWLNIDSNHLSTLGAVTIQNFWYLLRPTWINFIKTIPKFPHRIHYIKHIQTGNNNDIPNITIISSYQLDAFFKCLSLVLQQPFILKRLSHGVVTDTKVNPGNYACSSKIMLIRESVNGSKIYEPWLKTSKLTRELFPVCLPTVQKNLHIIPESISPAIFKSR
jgi:hypothetical protein